jgi:hypothetical protein
LIPECGGCYGVQSFADRKFAALRFADRKFAALQGQSRRQNSVRRRTAVSPASTFCSLFRESTHLRYPAASDVVKEWIREATIRRDLLA